MSTSRFRELIRCGVPDPFPHPEGGGKGTAPPPAPDYTGAANAQSAASKEIATQQTWANRPTINTPFGDQTWSAGAGVDPSTGQPVTNWSTNINLTPDQQQALDAQQDITAGRSQAAQTLLGQATGAFQTPFNWGAVPAAAATPQGQMIAPTGQQTGLQQYGLDTSAPQQTTQTTNEPAFAAQRTEIENSLFDRMRPLQEQAQDATRTRLANMGLSPGSEAYNREMMRLEQSQAAERYNAVQSAGQEQQRMQQMLLGQQGQAFGQDQAAQAAQNAALMEQFQQGQQAGQFTNQALQNEFQQQQAANQGNFGMGLQSAQFQNQARQQAIAEEAQRRGMPLSELNALLTGQQVNMPQMPSFNPASAGSAPNLLGAATAQGQYGLQAAQMNQSMAPDFGSLLGTAAKVAPAVMAFSDARLKTNIRRIGTHPRGVGIYRYTIFGSEEIGVMAQELLRVAPELVMITPSGYLAVNYGGL